MPGGHRPRPLNPQTPRLVGQHLYCVVNAVPLPLTYELAHRGKGPILEEVVMRQDIAMAVAAIALLVVVVLAGL
ncbi:hypothetical protein FHG89_03975 [Micromonospora orduensis]|uniref:Uncharacterized protein n=1 Tax=Micromonospora orduensis TaxID=1420891 RepID=A0A5C4QYI9_9ACTN|nr:hypothetical protein [Micromonospora orduensis]TNH31127.1 hypothetical protein FHG89_03975 [Micromonospora orduensis]